MLTQSDRLKAARRRAGYETAADAARAFGWPIPTYRSHEGDTRGIKHDIAAAYARAFRVSAEWIVYGRNPPRWAGEATVSAGQRVAMRVLPEIAWHAVGQYVRDGVGDGMVLAERDIEASERVGTRAFWARVPDDAMVASSGLSIARGALVAVDPDAACGPGDVVLAVPDGGHAPVLRRLQQRGQPGSAPAFDLRPNNADHPTLTVTETGGGRVLGRVIALQQMLV